RRCARWKASAPRWSASGRICGSSSVRRRASARHASRARWPPQPRRGRWRSGRRARPARRLRRRRPWRTSGAEWPSSRSRRRTAAGHPLKDALRVDGAAAAWVQALLAGYEVLDGGKALRRANGAVFLDGGGGGGPLQRRAELESLEQEVDDARASETRAAEELEGTLAELAGAEAAFLAAATGAERARQVELEAGSQKGDAERGAAHAQREAAEAGALVERLSQRLAEVEERLDGLHAELERYELERVRLDERLGAERAQLVDVE